MLDVSGDELPVVLDEGGSQGKFSDGLCCGYAAPSSVDKQPVPLLWRSVNGDRRGLLFDEACLWGWNHQSLGGDTDRPLDPLSGGVSACS